ncbi:MAG: AAA family ATPase, partial [Thermodesulfobacteriota bacterium]
SERGGILTNQVREEPYSVVLLDEVEKAHPYVLNLFLQVFDEGWLTDGRGKKVFFSDTIIVLTSNLGSDEFKKFVKPMGFLNDGKDVKSLSKSIMKEVEHSFSPEFLNRIDDIVVFTPLTRAEVSEIADLYLDSIRQSMLAYGKTLYVTPPALDKIVEEGFDQKYGARFLKRKIDDLVKIPVTLKWKEGDIFRVEVSGGSLTVMVEYAPDPEPAFM